MNDEERQLRALWHEVWSPSGADALVLPPQGADAGPEVLAWRDLVEAASLHQRQEFASAIVVLDRTLARGPSGLLPLTWLKVLNFAGYLNVAKGTPPNALSALLTAVPLARELGLSGEARQALSNLGSSFAWLGDNQRALHFTRQAASLVPDRSVGQTLVLLADYQATVGDRLGAQAALDELVARGVSPSHGQVWPLFVAVRGRLDPEVHGQAVLDLDVDTHRFEFLVGAQAEVLEGLGQSDRALALLVDALDRSSSEHLAWTALCRRAARLAKEQGELALAISLHERLDEERLRRARAQADAQLEAVESRLRERASQGEQLSAVNGALRRSNAALCEARDRAERLAKERQSFLASMSHELRTPLTAVIGVVDLMRGTGLSPEQQELLEIIEHSGRLVLTVIDDILDLRSLEEQRLGFRQEPFELRGPLADVVRTLAPEAARKGLALTHRLPPTGLMVEGDAKRLAQVALNLVGNAVKYTRQGEIHVHAEWEDNTLTLSVRDTGVGIPEAALATLFDPYVRVAGSERQAKGTGLGLSICKGLVEGMGGGIQVRSSLGEGSCFQVSLPLAQHTPKVALQGPTRSGQRAFHRVLLAEDEPVNRMVVARMLTALGVEVLLAEDGQEAVQIALREDPPLVLMDMHMPHLEGPEATRLLRERGFSGRILAFSASVMEDDRRRCVQAGMDGFLNKPVTREQLEAALRWTRPQVAS